MADDQTEGSNQPVPMLGSVNADPRFQDLSHALHAVDVEIERYETVVRSSPERRLGLVAELVKLRIYRSEILDKLRNLSAK
jgi:hypothetical protein